MWPLHPCLSDISDQAMLEGSCVLDAFSFSISFLKRLAQINYLINTTQI